MRGILTVLAAFLLSSSTLITVAQEPADKRTQADAEMQKNNFNDALQLYRDLLALPAGTSHDLQQALLCLQHLGKIHELDSLIESAVTVQPARFDLLLAASQGYQSAQKFGFLIAGKFERGGHRGGGEYASVTARDRIRSLQLLLQALQSAESDPTVAASFKADAWNQVAAQISTDQSTEPWKLQLLSDLTKLPDPEPGETPWMFRGRGPGTPPAAPVDEQGQPVFHKLPASWETAASDGERWRWALQQVSTLDPARRSTTELLFAEFLQRQFGAGTTWNQPWAEPVQPAQNNGKTDPQKSSLLSLQDSETQARLATGIKRFTLPDEFNFLKIARSVAERNDASARNALELLIRERMDRTQYPQAAALLRELLELTPAKEADAVRQRISQIEGNWLQFLSAETQPAIGKASFDIRFRNGRKVTFSAVPVNVDLLLDDLRKYLASNPEQPNFRRAQLPDIGWRLIEADGKKYLNGKPIEWTVDLNPADGHFDDTKTIEAPLPKAGAWWVQAQLQDGNTSRMILWLADLAIAEKQTESGTLIYVADAVTGSPVPRTDLQFFGWQFNYENQRPRINTSRFADRTDANGLCTPPVTPEQTQNQWLISAKAPDGRTAFTGFGNLWVAQKIEPLAWSPLKIYAITDRPIYRPGHTVNYSLWLRRPLFDGDNNEWAEKPVWIQIRNPQGEAVSEQQLQTDARGAVSGQYALPADAQLGTWTVMAARQVQVVRLIEENGQTRTVNETDREALGGGSFAVEEYRKPEYEVTVKAPEKPVALGEKFTATVSATYYFGAPVSAAKLHYRVERKKNQERWFPAARWDWLYSPGYWWFTGDYQWYPGFSRWGCLPPIRPWWNWNPDPPEIVSEGDALLGPDGNYSLEIDSANALASHPGDDHIYQITAEVVDQSRRTITGSGSVLAARNPFQVFAWMDRGHYQTGAQAELQFQARTPDGQPVSGTAQIRLLTTSWDQNQQLVEQEVQSWQSAAGPDGTGKLRLNLPQSGQYRASVTVTDAAGRQQEGAVVFFVRGPAEDGRNFRFSDLELIPDRQEYAVGDVVRLQISTARADSTVLLFVRAQDGNCPAPQVLQLQGKSTVVELPVTAADQPNFYVEALTVSNGKVFSEVREIVVPPEKRIAVVNVQPTAEKYRPGEQASINLKLTDLNGQPFRGNTVISVYDASLEALAASSIPEIRRFFWDVRRSHYLRSSSSLQRSESPVPLPNEPQMQFLRAESLPWNTPVEFAASRRGGMGMGGFGGGGRPELMMMAEGAPAAAMAVADAAPGMPAMRGMANPTGGMMGGAMAKGQAQGAEAAPALRSEFADTAFWTTAVSLDDDGTAEITFKVPDNLTTWKIKVWTLGDGTRVGSGESQIIAAKELMIRPQVPRFLTERDQIVLSAVINNTLPTEKSVRVVFEHADGLLKLNGPAEQTVIVPASGSTRVDWLADAVAPGKATIRMSALADADSDATEIQVPVNVCGLLKTDSFTGVVRPQDNSGSITVTVPEQRNADQSRLEVRFSPSLAASMVESLPYLIEYPYGCTEQTLNRFLPAVLVQRTLQRMNVSLEVARKQQIMLNSGRTWRGKYPRHWGQPPQRQTRDLRPLPAGFGMGSSTLAAWIQQHIDEDQKSARGLPGTFNPVFSEQQMNAIIRTGVNKLTEMQLGDGGWGWFSGYGEYSSPHTTAQVVHGLTIATQNDVPILPDVIQRGLQWLQTWQAAQLELLREGDRHRANPDYDGKLPFRMHADNLDAFIAGVLSEHNTGDPAIGEYLMRDRGQMTAYGLALTGLYMHRSQQQQNRDLVIQNLEQFLVRDPANQTAWLQLPEEFGWYWYGSENEAMAIYLQLKLAAAPQDAILPEMVKYLLNNRQGGSRWKSTRDTAMVVEAMAQYIQATGEDSPDMTVEVLIDGQVRKTEKITGENLFGFDGQLVLSGEELTTGQHTIEIRRQGRGPVWFSAWLTTFTKEQQITAAGLEVRVQRNFFRLERDDQQTDVQGGRGQAVKQQTLKYRRVPINDLEGLPSGTLVEVELVLDSRNDYEYLLLEDRKPSGFEPVDQRSGYVYDSLRAYREFRDDRVCLFLSSLARGQHSISYRLRAETPGTVTALPASIEGMYAPELIGNSTSLRLLTTEAP